MLCRQKVRDSTQPKIHAWTHNHFVVCLSQMVQLVALHTTLLLLLIPSTLIPSGGVFWIELTSAELWSSPLTWGYIQHPWSNLVISYSLWVLLYWPERSAISLEGLVRTSVYTESGLCVYFFGCCLPSLSNVRQSEMLTFAVVSWTKREQMWLCSS